MSTLLLEPIVEELNISNFQPSEDKFEIGQKVEQQTAILECHVGKPSFRKVIDSAHFMKVMDGLNEEQIAELNPEMRAMVEKFRSGHFAVIVKDDKPDEENKPDPSMIHVSQDLIDKKAIASIRTCDNNFRNWLMKKVIPSPIRFQGAYMLRLAEAAEINTRVTSYQANRLDLVEAMGEKWNATIAQAKTKRGPFFDPADYPPFSSVRSQYFVDFRWISFNVPEALKKMNDEVHKAIVEAESEKARIFYADAAQEARDAARIAFQVLVENLKAQLGTDESGKQKRFMGASVEKIKGFVEMFLGGGDLTGDGVLQNLASQIKGVLANVDPSEVRKEESVRTSLQNAVEALAQEASKMVVVSRRKFALPQEDSEPAPLSLD